MAETILNIGPYAIAGLGGVVPALVWLLFWLREDRLSPEPKGLIAISFFAGMAVVYFVLPVQKLIVATLPTIMDFANMLSAWLSLVAPSEQTVKITLWATTEEIAKYATVFFIAFKSKFFDEPIDAVVYILTAALGFTAMENTLYILQDMTHISVAQVFLDGNLRFIGATILHTVSSAFIGLAIAFSFYGSRFIKIIAVATGILGASLLHAYFNLSIIQIDGTMNTLFVFSRFWGAILIIIVLLQIVKRINPKIII